MDTPFALSLSKGRRASTGSARTESVVAYYEKFNSNPVTSLQSACGRAPASVMMLVRGSPQPRFALTGNMAGLNKGVPQPTEITLHQASRLLEISFADGKTFRLPCEFLRVFSPSAEVRGHGPGQEVLQTGKQEVTITAVEPVGQYAVQLRFSDGHDTGIYSWDLLYDYGVQQEPMWQQYLQRLQAAGASREKR